MGYERMIYTVKEICYHSRKELILECKEAKCPIWDVLPYFNNLIANPLLYWSENVH